MFKQIEMALSVKLLYFIVSVYLFLTIGKFMDLLDSIKVERKFKK